MKNLICTLCKEIPNIKINVLNYCNECFLKQVESKIHKNLRNLPYKSRVLIIFDGSAQSRILLKILDNLKNKKMHSFKIFNTTSEDNPLNFDFLDLETQIAQFNLERNPDKEIQAFLEERPILPKNFYCDFISTIKNGVDIVLYCKSVENICVDIFHKISSGVFIDESDVLDFKISNLCTFLNLFKDVKNKEIQYFAFLKNIKFTDETELTKKRASIKRFIQEIDKNNPLALFNIINTVKKIAKIN